MTTRVHSCMYCGALFTQTLDEADEPDFPEDMWYPDYCESEACRATHQMLAEAKRDSDRAHTPHDDICDRVHHRAEQLRDILYTGHVPFVVVEMFRKNLREMVDELCRRRPSRPGRPITYDGDPT